MRIRIAKPEEASILAALAWAAKASWGYSETQLQAWREHLNPTAESVGAQPTFVAEVGDELAGFCQLDGRTEPIELEHLWVHPQFMRQGVGKALLSHAARYLARSGIAALNIDSDPNAERFYIACGAVRIGERAAPIEGLPDRVRPQLRLATCQPDPSVERTSPGKRRSPEAARVKR